MSSLREDVEKDIRKRITEVLSDTKYDTNFCLDECDACSELLQSLVDIAMEFAGFSAKKKEPTGDFETIEVKD